MDERMYKVTLQRDSHMQRTSGWYCLPMAVTLRPSMGLLQLAQVATMAATGQVDSGTRRRSSTAVLKDHK